MYADTDVIYALIRPGDRHREYAERMLNIREKIYTSAITIVELEIVIKREISDELSKTAVNLAKIKIPTLKILPLGEKTLKSAEQLRKRYGLGIFDSIHAAAALEADGRIASTDEIYDRISGLKRLE